MTQADLEKLSFEDQCAYWKGRLLVAIGKGNLDDELFFMVDHITRIAYARGAESTKGKQ